MPISAHYGLTVLIWGLTWTAIRLQVESASVDLAVFYRFVMASVVALAVLAVARRLSRLTPGQHGWLFLFARRSRQTRPPERRWRHPD